MWASGTEWPPTRAAWPAAWGAGWRKAAWRSTGEHFVAAEVAELSGKAVETRVGRCTLIDPEELRAVWPERFSGGEAAVFDAVLRRVRLHRRLMYEDLVLEDRDRGDAPPELAAPILAERVVDGTLKLVKWDAAVACMQHCP